MERHKVITENLERLMAEKGFNPSSLAARAGLSHTAVRDILLGKSRNPKLATLEAIANAMGEAVTRITRPQTAPIVRGDVGDLTADFSEEEMRSLMVYISTLRQQRVAK